jgi:hypothetical protein
VQLRGVRAGARARLVRRGRTLARGALARLRATAPLPAGRCVLLVGGGRHERRVQVSLRRIG